MTQREPAHPLPQRSGVRCTSYRRACWLLCFARCRGMVAARSAQAGAVPPSTRATRTMRGAGGTDRTAHCRVKRHDGGNDRIGEQAYGRFARRGVRRSRRMSCPAETPIPCSGIWMKPMKCEFTRGSVLRARPQFQCALQQFIRSCDYRRLIPDILILEMLIDR